VRPCLADPTSSDQWKKEKQQQQQQRLSSNDYVVKIKRLCMNNSQMEINTILTKKHREVVFPLIQSLVMIQLHSP